MVCSRSKHHPAERPFLPGGGAQEGTELCRGGGGNAGVSLLWDSGTLSPSCKAPDVEFLESQRASDLCKKAADPPC